MKPKLILLFILVPVLCYSQLSTEEAPLSWPSQDDVLRHGDNATDSRRSLKDWPDTPNMMLSVGGTSEGLDSGDDCILYIENQTLTTSQTFTNACPVVMRNVTITSGANIVVKAQQYILLESGVEVTANSALDLSLY